MPGEQQPMPDAATVEAARSGDARALDALVGAYLPLVYNIVGRALQAPAEVDDVVQDVMLQMVRDLRQLRDPQTFRSWLVAIAMRQIRGHWRQRRAVPDAAALEDEAVPDPGADFVDLTIMVLGLSDQRREVVAATRWLDPEDRNLLTLWWLETAGELTRAELAAAMDSTPSKVAVLVHRTKARLETARAVVRALEARPRCPDLEGLCVRWDGRPTGVWRKRFARHVRECPQCELVCTDLLPAERLLVGLGLLPVPIALGAAVAAANAVAAKSAAAHAGRFALLRRARPARSVRHAAAAAKHGHGIARWAALSGGTKAAVVVAATLSLVATAAGVEYATASRAPAAAAATTAPHTLASATPVTPAATSPDPSPSTHSPSASASPSSTIVNTATPVRAAFYYPWYPENFSSSAGVGSGSHYTPSAGYYSVDEPSTVDRQIEDMQYGGLQAGIVSWWGQGLREDKRMPELMTEAAKLDFSWSAYYEKEGYSDPSVSEIAADLLYLRRYSDQKTWLHIGNRPVIFVYGDGSDGCGMASRWAQANRQAGYYVVLKVFPGYRSCADQPQGWHQYADTLDIQAGYSAIASPGFWKYDQASAQVPRDPAGFRQQVTEVAKSHAPFQLIVTYNEWGEGTAAESATAWASAGGHGVYMDILHQVFGEYPR